MFDIACAKLYIVIYATLKTIAIATCCQRIHTYGHLLNRLLLGHYQGPKMFFGRLENVLENFFSGVDIYGLHCTLATSSGDLSIIRTTCSVDNYNAPVILPRFNAHKSCSST